VIYAAFEAQALFEKYVIIIITVSLQNVAVELLTTTLLRICRAPNSNLGQETGYPHSIHFMVFLGTFSRITG
jgi:hypothetical protein